VDIATGYGRAHRKVRLFSKKDIENSDQRRYDTVDIVSRGKHNGYNEWLQNGTVYIVTGYGIAQWIKLMHTKNTVDIATGYRIAQCIKRLDDG
jgi:lysine/ornithine N-monooxygenase